jgi:twitching motility protein PilI
MAKNLNRRDFHEAVARRLAQQAEVAPLSRVGVTIGTQNWLLNLADIIEVVAVPRTTPVPHTRDWFIGIANVRGNLYGIIDTARFWGGPPTLCQAECRVLLTHPRFMINSGLIVTRMLGLRDPNHWQAREPGPTAPSWCTRQFLDEEERLWNELDLRVLLSHPDFLQAAQK